MDGFERVIVWLVVIAIVVIGLGRGCIIDDSEACHSAETLGMRECRVTNAHRFAASIFGCGRDDAAAFEITATNSANQHVNATVCCGWPFKGCTLRTQ